MKNQLTPQALALYGAVALILAIIGAAGYFQIVMLKVAAVPAVPKGYTASIMQTELLASGVFTKVATLVRIPASEPETAAAYNADGDLGKVNITKYE